MFATSNLIKIFSSKIENPSDLSPSFHFENKSSLVDLFANSPSLGDILYGLVVLIIASPKVSTLFYILSFAIKGFVFLGGFELRLNLFIFIAGFVG